MTNLLLSALQAAKCNITPVYESITAGAEPAIAKTAGPEELCRLDGDEIYGVPLPRGGGGRRRRRTLIPAARHGQLR